MGKKSQNKTGKGANIKSNLAKRVARAKRQGKSENYLKDLELALSKRH